jgi:Cellulase (glycosyl hydrolase family 5)
MNQFTVNNGKITDMDGRPWIAMGVNCYDPNAAADVLRLFPGINFCRLPTPTYVDPSFWQPFIDFMTARKVVCEPESHPWPLISEPPPDGYADWVGRMAAAFKDNPYVWGGSLNEPQGGDMTAEHTVFYQAWRGAGNNNPIMFMGGLGGGNPGQTGLAVLNGAAYAAMRNVVFCLHFYGWSSGYSTDQATVNAKLLGNAQDTGILALQAIHSADGPMPIIIGEFGPSTSGQSLDANAAQVIEAVSVWAVENGYTAGFAGWCLKADPFNDVLEGGILTPWGKQLAAAIDATAATTKGSTMATASPNNTVVTGTAAGINDASGNVWRITSAGQVSVNGFPDTTTASVVKLVYAGGNVFQTNQAGGWWSKTKPSDVWTAAIAPVIPAAPAGPVVTAATIGAEVDVAIAQLAKIKADLGSLT